jgi:hypothetical protein
MAKLLSLADVELREDIIKARLDPGVIMPGQRRARRAACQHWRGASQSNRGALAELADTGSSSG